MSGLDDHARAAALEAADPLPTLRERFAVPPWPEGAGEWAYFAGNSLGLMPRSAAAAIEAELAEWGRVAVEGWFEAAEPWLEYAGTVRESLGRLVKLYEGWGKPAEASRWRKELEASGLN